MFEGKRRVVESMECKMRERVRFDERVERARGE